MADIGTRISWDGGLAVSTGSFSDDDAPVLPPPSTPAYRGMTATVIDSVTTTGPISVPTVRTKSDVQDRYRLVVGGKDVTYWRGVQTPMPTYALIEPLLYGSGSISFPQMHAAFEKPGEGSLSWLKKFSVVKVQRVNAAEEVIATDYRGFISDDQPSGRDNSFTLGGEATGLAAMQDRPVPIFAQRVDVGTQVMATVEHQLRLPTGPTPDTGIVLTETGGGSTLDFLTAILAKSTQRDGTQWTVAPGSRGVYKMFQKDMTTIDASVYIDGFRVVEALRRDYTEEPNRAWTTGVAPDGKRIRFAIFPGLQNSDQAYPGSTLNPGDTGDSVVALIWRLYTVGYLDEYPPSEWSTDSDDPVTSAIEDVQDDAGLSVTGTVNAATWNAIFRGDNFSLRRSQQKPAAQKPFTQAFLRDASGNILGPNPAYVRSKPFVDISPSDMTGFTRRQIQRWSQRELANPDVPNWVGTITITMGAVIAGEHNPGDPFHTSDLMDARAVKPGMNLWLANWHGGTLVHVSGANTSAGSVELTVDSRARDTMKVWEVITRNRESRKSAERNWIAQNRRSGQVDDTGAFYDGSVFGRVPRTFLPGNQWTIVPTPAGRSGQIQVVDFSLVDAAALSVMAAFGKEPSDGRLNRVIGNPMTVAGSKNFTDNAKTLEDDMFLAWAHGGKSDAVYPGQFCGYWPQHVTNAMVTTTQTGTAQAAGDTITITGHGYSNGDQVTLGGSLPTGLYAQSYFVVSATTNTFQVADTSGGAANDITTDATGVKSSRDVPQAAPPVTGDFREKAGVPYLCVKAPVLFLAFYPDRDCHLQGGRILELLLDDTAG